MTARTITHWRTVGLTPYAAPEQGVCLRGRVDGHTVQTSRIVSTHGRECRTESGSVYVLGEPDPEFAAWCEERGKPIDPVRPVKVGAA